MSSVPPPLTQHYLRHSSASDADVTTQQSIQQKLIIRFVLSNGERHALTAEYGTVLSTLLGKLWLKCHIQHDQSYYVIRLLHGEIYFQTLHKLSQIVKIAQCFNEQYIAVNSTAPLVIDLLVQPANDIGHNVSREQRTAHSATGTVQCSSTVYKVNKSSLLSKQHKKQHIVLIDITLFIYENEAQYKSNQTAADYISMSSVTASIAMDTALQHKQYTYGLELNCDSVNRGLITILFESDLIRTQWLQSIQTLNMRHTKSLCIAVCEELVARGTRNAGIKTEGIFRISGNKDTVQQLKQQYSLSQYPRLSDVSDDHALAGLLKLTLRQMNEPLLTYTLYGQWLHTAHINDIEQRVSKCIELSKLMPASNYYFASYLMYFLARVAHYSSMNMMHSKNLAVVIAPNILKPEIETVQTLSQDNQYVLIVVQTLIDHCARIWPRSPYDKPSISRPRSIDSTQKIDLSNTSNTHTIVAEPSIDLTYLTVGSSNNVATVASTPPSLNNTGQITISLNDTIQSLQSQLQQLNQQYEMSLQQQQTSLQQLQSAPISATQQQQFITILSNEIDKKQSTIDHINMTNIQLQQLYTISPNTSPHRMVNSTSFTYLPPAQPTNTVTNDTAMLPPPRRAAVPPPLPVLPRCLSATTPVSSQHTTPAHSPIRDISSTRSSNADINDTQSLPLPPSRRSSATAPNGIAAELKALHAAKQLNNDFNTATTQTSDASTDSTVDRRSSTESNISPTTVSDTPTNAINAENTNNNAATNSVVSAIAKFNYQCGQRKLDITLTRGDPIEVDEQDESKNGAGWLHGINRATGEIGYFPKTYVKIR